MNLRAAVEVIRRASGGVWGVVALYSAAAVIGFVAAVVTLGWDVITGDTVALRSATGDTAAGMAGFRYFVEDDWHLPLLHADRLDAPEGTVVAFSDSIPILALVAKALRGLGVTTEQWWGGWLAATFVAQATGTVFALRGWRVRGIVVPLLAASVVVFFPPFLFRHMHPALAMHGILLVALGVGGRLRTGEGRFPLPSAVGLLAVAFLIHPYHLLACGVVVIACALDGARLGVWSARRLLEAAGALVVTLGGVAWIGGYLAQDTAPASGYGSYSLIPTSPLWPQLSSLLPGEEPILDTVGSAEGYAYFGAGALLLVVTGAGLAVVRARQLFDRIGSLIVGLVALLAYGITPHVHLSPGLSLDLSGRLSSAVGSPVRALFVAGLLAIAVGVAALAVQRRRTGRPPSWTEPSTQAAVAVLAVGVVFAVAPSVVTTVVGMFRASGRLVWPVWYAVILGAVVLAVRHLDRRVVLGVLVVAVGLQIADTADLRRLNDARFTADEARSAELTAMSELIALHDDVSLAPDFLCAGSAEGILDFIDVVAAASIVDSPIDNAYVAREPGAACADRFPPRDSDTLFVAAGPGLALPPELDCRAWTERITACTDRWARLSPSGLDAFAPPPG
ncbi:MAG: DUF6311 domain-containing protein [Actinomycetota bacterium]